MRLFWKRSPQVESPKEVETLEEYDPNFYRYYPPPPRLPRPSVPHLYILKGLWGGKVTKE